MTYRLRNFDNNFQVVASLGWIIILMSLIFLFTERMPGFLIFTGVGLFLIWIQLRGKRIMVDTDNRVVKNGKKSHQLTNPIHVIVNRVRMAQTVNSRVSSSNVSMFFYKGYIQDGEEKILISSNRSEKRDMQKLIDLAQALDVDLILNY